MSKVMNKSLALKIQNISKDEFALSLKQSTKYFKKKDYKSAIDWIYFAATLAWYTNPGFFCSPDLEDILKKIGQKLDDDNEYLVNIQRLNNVSRKKRILHILSTAYLTGGHTRLVAHWIDNCRTNCQDQVHSIIVTNQEKNKVPDWLINSAKDIGGECIVFPNNLTWLQKAYALRSITKEWAEIIILHIHPNDPIPIIAFSPTDWDIPILFCNHADHVFSLGTSISDVILDIRKSGQQITKYERKAANKSKLLPIPLMDKFPLIDQERDNLRKQARKNLNMPLSAGIILTIGSEYKYKPALGYNFSECIKKILLKDTTVHIYAIGLPNLGSWKALSKEMEGRFHPVGIIIDRQVLQDYYLAADVYIEGFPLSSLTAMLDAGLYMLPIQRINNSLTPIFSGDDIALDKLISVANNEEEYIDSTIKLVHTSFEIKNNLGKKIRDSILTNHCDKEWVDRWLSPIIEKVALNKYKREDMTLMDENQVGSRFIENLSLSLFQWEYKSPILIPLDALLHCYKPLSNEVRCRILLSYLDLLCFRIKHHHKPLDAMNFGKIDNSE